MMHFHTVGWLHSEKSHSVICKIWVKPQQINNKLLLIRHNVYTMTLEDSYESFQQGAVVQIDRPTIKSR